MESLSRPPHRRKHSTTTNIFSSSFSFKSPYDGVLLSNGGERKSLEAHEYSEIFSGSSSIPVLDIPDLDEPAGPGDPRDSKLDYSNIFGGFTSDDVFVPYEKLLNRSAKKSKPRMPAESRPHLQESGARNSSRKTQKPSDEASDQSVDEVQKQINISFNQTNQRNGDASDGKTHVAELHAVPGFTHFFDGTPRLDKTKNDKLPSLKREVSRTWSFSAEVGRPKDKGRSSSETSQVGDKSHNVNEVNLKSQFSKVPPPSTCPSNPSGNKDPGFSRASFVSKEDASEKIFGDCLPPFPSEEFDENSVDAVSAAALKKAIEQAQESIRIAKMIMERKKEGYQDGSKPRPISSLNVSDREAQIDREAYVSKDNNAKGKHEELGHMFNVLAGIDGKFTQTLSHSDTTSNAANSEVEKIWENVGADKKHGEAFAGKSERLHNGEHVKLEMLEENVEATDTQREAKEFPGSVANGVSGTVDLEPGKVGNINSLMPSWFKLPSNVGDMVNFKWRHVTSHHRERSGVIAEQVEKAVDTSQTMQRTGKSVDEDELCQATFDHAKGSVNLVERVLETSQMTEGVEKSVDEDELCEATFSHAKGPESTVERVLNTYQRTTDCCKFVDEAVVSIRQEGEVNKQRENENGNESLEQEDMENRYKNASNGKENGEHGEIHDEEIRITRQKEAHLWFGSKEQLKEALLEEITKREPDIPSETREVEKKVGECHEPEIDNRKQDFTDDGDEPKLAEGLVQNKFEEEHISTCEHGAAGAVEIQEGSFWDAEVTDNALEDSGRHGDNYNKCEIQEAAYEDNIDEAVELSSSDASTIFDEAQTNDEAQSKDTGPIISETQEACNVDLNNKAEEHQETVNFFNEDDTMHEVSETVSAAEDKKAEPFFHLQDNETLGPNSLRRSASEEIFVENKLDDAFEGLSSDGKMDTVGAMDADPEENLPEDENVSHTTSDVHDSEHEYAAKIDAQNFPEHLASDIRTTEFDFADVRQVVEQTSESDEGSVSASNSEKIDRLSAHESEEWAENVMDKISDVEELKDELGDERKYVEDLSRDFFSELHSEPKEMDKPKKTGRDEEKGLNTENNKDNLAGTSLAEERDTKESEQHFDSNHQQQRIEAIKRGREREKDRIAVERAIREARERAFAEARERAERAAVEKASAEARQRVMTEAKEKVEKASTEAKLRAERAAVERATAEARERALEKAMSQKTSTERVSSSSRNDGLKHSFSSSDLENGMNTESAQRRKARLERHQRIMERAAKALAEKNMRDLLAQKEQAERNRLAESLDADIKRWATGKEGNLRALLSTLQYILGTDNGWQPISLTEIITTAAVKKAYRKATLYVHPDKLQQRGASVQQKYICEKVFDLLKAAWNRFNSDER